MSTLSITEVPEELGSPCYTDQYEQEHVKPAVISLLLSADVYCRAYRKALPHDNSPPRDNANLLLLLARKGFPPVYQGEPVKNGDLREKPIRMVRTQVFRLNTDAEKIRGNCKEHWGFCP